MDFAWIALCAVIGPVCVSNQDLYCYTKDENPFRRFGVRTPYDVVQAEKIEVLGGECKPKYIQGLMRHPTRYCGEDCWNKEKMEALQQKIVDNFDKNENLCQEDKDALRNWKYSAGLDLSVPPQGFEDVRGIAKRLKEAFGELLNEETIVQKNFNLATSSSRRCNTSALEFTNVLLNTNFQNCKEAGIEFKDELLKVRDDIKKKNSPQKLAFENSGYVHSVVQHVSMRLGFPDDKPLSKEEVLQLYFDCAYENSWYPKTHPGLCAAFTPEQLKVFEFLDDVLTYYYCGYGANNDETFADNLLKDLIDNLNNAAKNESEDGNAVPKLGTFYFTHNIAIVPFLKRFNLYKNEEPLTLENYETQKDKREFRSSEFNNFSSNVVTVLYECDEDYKVVFYLNENKIKLPMCKTAECTLKELNEYYDGYRATLPQVADTGAK